MYTELEETIIAIRVCYTVERPPGCYASPRCVSERWVCWVDNTRVCPSLAQVHDT